MLFAHKWCSSICSACSSQHKLVVDWVILYSATPDDVFADSSVNGVDSVAKVMICVTSV